jgi:hypothetical protein
MLENKNANRYIRQIVCELKSNRHRFTQVTDKCHVKMVLLAQLRRMPLLESARSLCLKNGTIFLSHSRVNSVNSVNSKDSEKGKGRAVELSFVSEKAPRVDTNLDFGDPEIIWRKGDALESDEPANDC